jgi:two-component system sensor histidine kinase UhpB
VSESRAPVGPLRTITGRYSAALIALLALVTTCSGLTLYWSLTGDIHDELHQRAELVATALSESAYYDLLHGDKGAAQRSMQRVVTAGTGVVQIVLLDPRREPLLVYGEIPSGRQSQTVEIATLAPKGIGESDGPSKPTGYVRLVVTSEALVAEKLNRLGRGVTALAAVGASLGVFGVWLIRRLSQPLRHVSEAMQLAVDSQFDFSTAPQLAGGEIGEMQTAVRALAERLDTLKQQQAEHIDTRTRDLQVAVSAAARSNEEKQRLLAYGNQVVEEERKRIAGAIHDTLGASLVAVRFRAEGIAAKAAAVGQPEIETMADRIVDTVQELHESTRSIVRMLRPELLEMLGLTGAVREMLRRFNEANKDCTFELRLVGDKVEPPGPIAIVAYRVVQEAMTNIVKHAGATHVLVAMGPAEPPRQIRIVVTDNGRGIDHGHASTGSGLGLIGMRERVAASGGIQSITSDASGTTITVAL